MKNLVYLLIVIVIAFAACDQGGEMIKPVIKDIMADDSPVSADDTPVYSQYDVNQDGEVNDADWSLVQASVGQSQPANPRLDVDGNGIIDKMDLTLVFDNFSEFDVDTPQPTETPVLTEATPTTEYLLPTTPGPDWELGVYRMRVWPTSWQSGNENYITSLSWGPSSEEIWDHGLVRVIIKPRIWAIDLENERVIELNLELTVKNIEPTYDEVSLEITRFIGETTEQDGRRTYTVWEYEGRAIANLSRPEIIFEEINP